MSTFRIPESRLSQFQKRMRTIEKKCAEHHYTFTCNQIGEDYVKVETKDKGTVYVKYFVYEVEGCVKHDGWEFVATLDHHEGQNVIRRFNKDLIIPDKYLTCGPACDHCNRIRSRKDTYLIYNIDQKEFKQVGKSCLQEYTNGIDAEFVAFMNQFVVDCENELGGYGGGVSGFTPYLDVEEVLNFAFECYRHFGYSKSYFDDGDFNPNSTKQRVLEYMSTHVTTKAREEMEEVGFDRNSEYAVSNTAAALEWIKSQPDNSGEFIHNLKTIASDEYTERRNVGILVSLTITYFKAIERETKKKSVEELRQKEHEAELVSQFQGEKVDKITVKCTSFVCITTSYNEWGASYLYKFSDEDGNIYAWWASRGIDEPDKVTQVTGTVKEHSEFRGIKQTILTRCKVA